MVETRVQGNKGVLNRAAIMFLAVIAAMTIAAAPGIGCELAFADDDVMVTSITGDDSQYQDDNSDKVRDKEGVVSQLNTTTHNPYNKLITVRIDVGAEFADFEGSDNTEAIVVKCGPGDYIDLPKLKAKPGYTFIGWNQGGVSEPMWEPDITTVQMTDDPSGGKMTVIDAIYMDDEGNGFCTCGAWVEGYFADNIDYYKDVYAQYLEANGFEGGTAAQDSQAPALNGITIAAIAIAAVLAVIVVICIIRLLSAGKRRIKDDDEFVNMGQHGRPGPGTEGYRPVASDEQIAVYDSLHPELRPAVDFVAAIEAASKSARG